MKKTITLIYSAIVIALCLNNHLSYAQWQTPPTSGIPFSRYANTWAGGTDSTHSVGIGDFWGQTPTQYPHAFLHVNSNYLTLPANGSISNYGEVFRTDCPALNSTIDTVDAWRMFTNGNEIGGLFNYYNATTQNDLTIKASINNMLFRTGDVNTNYNWESMRMTRGTALQGITSLATPNVNRISIPEYFQEIKQPLSLMHLGFGMQAGTNSTNWAWRKWQDIGSFYSTGFINLYVGFKKDTTMPGSPWSPTTDPVISWGWNNYSTNATNINNCPLRFIYTSPKHNNLIPHSSTFDGVEIARMVYVPKDSLLLEWEPRMGIGGDTLYNSYFNNADSLYNSPYPSATLEINSPDTNDLIGNSGLRFTDLTLKSPTSPASNDKVLTVDSTGYVILTQSNGMDFNNCNCPAAQVPPMTYSKVVSLNNHNMYFMGNYSNHDTTNSVLIGDSCGYFPKGKLDIYQHAGMPDSAISSTGIYLVNGDYVNTTTSVLRGIYSEVRDPVSRGIEVAGQFMSHGRHLNLGVAGLADGKADTAFTGQPTTANFGGAFWALGKDTIGNIYNFGVGGAAYKGKYNIGVYGFSPVDSLHNFAGYFDGDVYCTSFYLPSDARLKTNIDTMKNVLSKIRQLTPVNFDFDTKSFPQLNLSTYHQAGLISQEVEKVIPDVVGNAIAPPQYDEYGKKIYDTLHIKSLSYIQLIPYELEGIKELDSITSGLSKRIDTVKITADNGLTAIDPFHVQLGGRLLDETRIDLDTNNFIFNDTATISTGKHRVLINENQGKSYCEGKLDVYNKTEMAAGNFITDSTSNKTNVGVFSVAIKGTGMNAGGVFEGIEGSNVNFGVRGNALSEISKAVNCGGLFQARGGNSLNISVWGMSKDGLSHSWAGAFTGNVFNTANQYLPADTLLKGNTKPFSNALQIIQNLKPQAFYFDTTNYFYMSLPSNKQYGLSASNLDTILPELVKDISYPYQMTNDTIDINFKGINYTGLIPITIQAVKDIDSIASELKDHIDTLKINADNGLTSDKYFHVELGGQLLKETRIDLDTNNLIFIDTATISTGKHRVLIGENPAKNAFIGKFDVYNRTEIAAGNFYTDSISYNTAGAGIIAMSYKAGSYLNAGGIFEGMAGAYMNIGVGGVANSSHPNTHNCGGLFQSQGTALINYGVSSDASGGTNSSNYGIYASAYGGSYATAGYFDGDLTYTGSLIGPSDSLLKSNIAPMTNAMSIISRLKPKTFYFKTHQYPYLNLSSTLQYGLIAQDVESVLPGIVKTNIQPEKIDSTGNVISPSLAYKGLDYIELIPIMIKGMNEQQATIDSLKQALHALLVPNHKTMNNDSNDSTNNHIQYVELKSEFAIVLNQNDPNPFAEETDITYYLPETVSKAMIMFYDNTGKIIKSVELIGNGNGTLHVYASNLSAGLYMYSLVADGKTIDTKKMVCAKK